MMPRRITALLVLVPIGLTFAQGLAAPVPKLDVVKHATDAAKATAEAIRSGAGVVAFEGYLQEPEETETRLWTKGRVKVYFKDEKYHFRFKYETMMVRTIYHDKQGKKTGEKIAEWKPDDLAVIFDGTIAQEITYRQGIRPGGCSIHVFDSLRNAHSFVDDDLTRLWLKKIGMERVVKSTKREAIQVADLGSGNYLLSYKIKAIPQFSHEIHVSSKVNYNPTRFRVRNSDWDRDTEEWSAKWKKIGNIWYVEELDTTLRIRHSDKPTYRVTRSVYRSESFEPNAKVDPQLFTLDCLTIPPGTRTLDHRPVEKR